MNTTTISSMETSPPQSDEPIPTPQKPRYGRGWSVVIVALTVIGVLLTASQVFFWTPFGRTLLTNEYLYLVLAIFLPIIFITRPISKKASGPLSWYDLVFAGLAMALNLFFAIN